MPTSVVRLSAGRREMPESVQALCFLAGANSIFYGDRLLTTGNPDAAADRALLAKLGLQPALTGWTNGWIARQCAARSSALHPRVRRTRSRAKSSAAWRNDFNTSSMRPGASSKSARTNGAGIELLRARYPKAEIISVRYLLRRGAPGKRCSGRGLRAHARSSACARERFICADPAALPFAHGSLRDAVVESQLSLRRLIPFNVARMASRARR